jgi:molybdopterin converting factor subunit 1
MTLQVLAFGITRDIIGASSIALELHEGSRVSEVLTILQTKFPRLTALTSLLVAVNEDYAEATQILTERDTLALIPPVSGG